MCLSNSAGCLMSLNGVSDVGKPINISMKLSFLLNLKQGQTQILNADMTHDLYTLNQEAPEMYLDEIQDLLALTYDTGIAKTTLFENIRDMGITYKLLQKAAAERDDE